MADYASYLPVNLLTGFLGSGKTTLLKRLLDSPQLKSTAVLINEFGEVGLDHLLLESVDEETVLLQSGCICCTIRGDLRDAIRGLYDKREQGTIPAFDRMVIETTGLADPAPIISTLMADPVLRHHFRLGTVVATVDAVNGAQHLKENPESVKQAAVADRLVLTKSDLVDTVRAAAKDALLARVRALNPGAPVLDATAGEATAARLLSCGLYDPERKSPDVKRWLAAEAHADAHARHAHGHDPNRHDVHIRAFAYATDAAIGETAFEMFLDLLRATHGPNLLRLKGIVKIAEMPERPVVIHGVQHVFHPPAQLESWPDEDRRTRMVFIVRDIAPETISALFDAFLGAAQVDQPDRAAIVDNPLVPFGGPDR